MAQSPKSKKYFFKKINFYHQIGMEQIKLYENYVIHITIYDLVRTLSSSTSMWQKYFLSYTCILKENSVKNSQSKTLAREFLPLQI